MLLIWFYCFRQRCCYRCYHSQQGPLLFSTMLLSFSFSFFFIFFYVQFFFFYVCTILLLLLSVLLLFILHNVTITITITKLLLSLLLLPIPYIKRNNVTSALLFIAAITTTTTLALHREKLFSIVAAVTINTNNIQREKPSAFCRCAFLLLPRVQEQPGRVTLRIIFFLNFKKKKLVGSTPTRFFFKSLVQAGKIKVPCLTHADQAIHSFQHHPFLTLCEALLLRGC